MNTHVDPTSLQVTKYVDQLAKELTSVPKTYRVDVVEGVRAHIHDALESGDANVATILERLGTPQTVAAQALQQLDEEPGQPSRPTASTRARKLQMYSFLIAAVVVLVGGFFSQPDLNVPIPLSSLPPLALTLIPLLTRGSRWWLVSTICATGFAAFLVTALILSLALGSFSFPLTVFLIPPLTAVVFYLPALGLTIVSLLFRRR
ncbi:HAAS signaling domain-containing protein [Glaciibacter superstes]|uniref:HAAS signaling domain-containing protein n=1 Tax=Glaciibacter superstes TaxID=501023 RepID=UPI0003B2EAEB|nr:hypothetical protein [Glaciibacter superstes]